MFTEINMLSSIRNPTAVIVILLGSCLSWVGLFQGFASLYFLDESHICTLLHEA